jgi:Rrf2 family iron-sulfur cluster assembly transcriptional regulator
MRITTKGRYALRAMANLARDNSQKPKAIKNIAAEENISPEFLEQIFFKLKKSGVISSVRGPGGGFVITKPLTEINVADIFLAVDEGLDLSPCTAACNDVPEFDCDQTDNCLAYVVWKDATLHITEYFRNLTLEAIVSKNRHRAALLAMSGDLV